MRKAQPAQLDSLLRSVSGKGSPRARRWLEALLTRGICVEVPPAPERRAEQAAAPAKGGAR
ncbi:MAG: hypothetical protein JNM56_33035 [Planctomycetia bacterium]|nr:hypothetical protein [Planctomycetia bacterium]